MVEYCRAGVPWYFIVDYRPELDERQVRVRNLERVLVTVPSELEVAAVVWARSIVVTESALPLVEQRAGKAVPA